MRLSNVGLCEFLELSVILFQVFGVAALCLSRLFPSARWSGRGKVCFVFAMIGLGIAGALCGRQDSEFALFAGGTMTALLIGMTMGGGPADATARVCRMMSAEAGLAGP